MRYRLAGGVCGLTPRTGGGWARGPVVDRLLFTLVTTVSIWASPLVAQSRVGDVSVRQATWSGYRTSVAGSYAVLGPTSGMRMVLPYPRGPRPLDLGGHVKAAVAGAIVMGLLGALAADGLCHFDDPCRHPAPFVVGGFVLGAPAGAAIGVRIATWHGG